VSTADPTPKAPVGLDNVAYWETFWANAHPDIQGPTTFAQDCMRHLRAGERLFELGCGNGRDALFFAASGLHVIASDRCGVAIARLSLMARVLAQPPTCIVADMGALGDEHAQALDAVYSRFTLHAVSRATASRALAWAARSLQPGGRFFIEVRSVLGSLYGVGEPVERDAFLYNDHYRRFVRKDELCDELAGLGLALTEVVESAGIAVYKDDDPVVIRVVATRD
jgi:SAM-dependent methyltransferase